MCDLKSNDTSLLTWSQLIQALREAFSSDSVDIDHVNHIMSSYVSDREDWNHYANFDPHKYTRNLVDENNGKYNLIVLCWGEGHGSSIHDHADSHCFMKVLLGNLKETQFHWPDKEESDKKKPLKEKGCKEYSTNDVTYINDSIGLHRVENPSHTDRAVSLHLYSPPIQICKAFDQRTGTCHNCCMTFYSKSGQKCCS